MEYIPDAKVREWCKAHGWDADHYSDAFNDYLLNRTRKPYRNTDAAFRNCVRSDWFRIRAQKDYRPPVFEKPKERPVNGMVWSTDRKEWVKA